MRGTWTAARKEGRGALGLGGLGAVPVLAELPLFLVI
jgi:hypothetical protein